MRENGIGLFTWMSYIAQFIEDQNVDIPLEMSGEMNEETKDSLILKLNEKEEKEEI